MYTSLNIENISVAMVEALSKMPPVKMNKKNPFLKNKYADLGAVIETSQPILAASGLAISQTCTSREGYVGVETTLLHKSGEWMSSSMELPLTDEKGKSTAQVAGSIITYIRRYSLAAILGMYADEDGDGNGTPKSVVSVKKEEVEDWTAEDYDPINKVQQGIPPRDRLQSIIDEGLVDGTIGATTTVIMGYKPDWNKKTDSLTDDEVKDILVRLGA